MYVCMYNKPIYHYYTYQINRLSMFSCVPPSIVIRLSSSTDEVVENDHTKDAQGQKVDRRGQQLLHVSKQSIANQTRPTLCVRTIPRQNRRLSTLYRVQRKKQKGGGGGGGGGRTFPPTLPHLFLPGALSPDRTVHRSPFTVRSIEYEYSYIKSCHPDRYGPGFPVWYLYVFYK